MPTMFEKSDADICALSDWKSQRVRGGHVEEERNDD
jgi:hypothetical protein